MTSFENIHSEIDPDTNYLNEPLNDATDSPSPYYSVADFNHIVNKRSNELLCVSYNIRSYNANKDTFFTTFQTVNSYPDVMVLTETWFTDENAKSIDSYNCYHTIRSDRRSGGVSIYVSDKFKSASVPELCFQNETIEICTISITVGSEKWYIMGIYRPHSDTVENFTSALESAMNLNEIKNGKRCMILGDINADLLNMSPQSENFANFLYSRHYMQKVTHPTRFSPQSVENCSLLDHIWINWIDQHKVGIIANDFVDHCATFILIPYHPLQRHQNYSKVKITFRPFSEQNLDKFKTYLNNHDWNSVSTNDLDAYLKKFIETIDYFYCKCFPTKTKYVSLKSFRSPWITDKIKTIISYKSLCFNLLRNGLITRSENNLIKNKIKRIMDKTERKYYEIAFIKCKNNMKFTWNLLKSLNIRGRGTTKIEKIIWKDTEFTGDSNIADTFNEYFGTIAQDLQSQIPETDLDPLTFLNKNDKSMYLYPMSTSEVIKILSQMKVKKSKKDSCPDYIFLKKINLIIAPILCNIVNICFQRGIFPNCLKIGCITPIFKKGNIYLVINYRPITVLILISKLLEKCFLTRSWSFINKFSLLTKHQYGFIRGTSTEDALLDLTEKLYADLNNKKYALTLFIDYQKAFDTVDHHILLSKLEAYGFRGPILRFLESYLSNREVMTKFNGKFSPTKTLSIGLPQGGLLSPVLFLLYINDLPNISNNFHPILYADDTTLCFSGSNISNLLSTCNLELAKFSSWTMANKLSVNFSKTQYLIVSTRNIPSNLPPITINDNIIERVSSFKFLGIIIDSSLNFNEHIKYISGKISKSIGVLYSIRHLVPENILNSLYYNFIYPYLYYGIIVWGNTYTTHLQPIRILQKRAIRVINKQQYLSHSNPLFIASNILKVDEIYKFKLSQYFFKHNLSENYSQTHSYSTRSRTNEEVVPEFQRLAVCQRSIHYAGPRIWNLLPQDVKSSESIHIFKNRAKSYFLASYY